MIWISSDCRVKGKTTSDSQPLVSQHALVLCFELLPLQEGT